MGGGPDLGSHCERADRRPPRLGRNASMVERATVAERAKPSLLKVASFNLERGEASPLLRKSRTRKDYDKDELPVSDLEQSLLHHKHKPSDWKAPLIILAFECLESTAFFGIGTNLIVYLSTQLNETNAESVTNVATWTGTSFMTPLIGAFIADSFLGSYKTTLLSALLYLLGMITITLSCFLPSLNFSPLLMLPLPSAAAAQKMVFYIGLYLVAFGCGGLKSSLLPLGADQFDDDNPADTERKSAFIGWFYVCITFGMLSSGTIIVWLQDNVSWVLGYGISTACIAVGLVAFLVATPLFRRKRPNGSPLKSILQVLIASCKKMKVEVPSDSSFLYEVPEKDTKLNGQQRLAHTEEFSFLDKAAVIESIDELHDAKNYQWKLCTVTQIEELKALIRIVPVFLTSVIYSVAYCQMTTTFIEQGKGMDTKIGSFSVSPAMLSAIEVLFVVFWSLVYDNFIVPLARKYTGNSRGLSTLQRMGIGRFMMILTMAIAAFVETKRLESVQANAALSLAWQLPQYFIIGSSDALNYIGQLEFFYDESPESMKSLGTALYLLSIALGSYLNSMIVTIVQAFTSSGGQLGWIPNDLDKGHMDYFYWVMAALSTMNFVFHITTSRKYTVKQVAFWKKGRNSHLIGERICQYQLLPGGTLEEREDMGGGPDLGCHSERADGGLCRLGKNGGMAMRGMPSLLKVASFNLERGETQVLVRKRRTRKGLYKDLLPESDLEQSLLHHKHKASD